LPTLKKLNFFKKMQIFFHRRCCEIGISKAYQIKRYKNLLLILTLKNYLLKRRGRKLRGWEEKQMDYLFTHMKNGCDIFIDVGANIGIYSLRTAQLGYAPIIYAFEPDPRNYSQFRGNLLINNMIDRIQLYQLAVSSLSGELGFHPYPDGYTDMTRVADANYPEITKFKTTTLDDMITAKGKKIFIKIDVEGHELAVLKGATRVLRENDCFLQIEIWKDNVASIHTHMKNCKYSIKHHIHDDYYFITHSSNHPQSESD